MWVKKETFYGKNQMSVKCSWEQTLVISFIEMKAWENSAGSVGENEYYVLSDDKKDIHGKSVNFFDRDNGAMEKLEL